MKSELPSICGARMLRARWAEMKGGDDTLKDALAKYLRGLERAAESFDENRLSVARDAIMLTVRFLMDVNVDAHLLAPLTEATETIHAMLIPTTMPKSRRE